MQLLFGNMGANIEAPTEDDGICWPVVVNHSRKGSHYTRKGYFWALKGFRVHVPYWDGRIWYIGPHLRIVTKVRQNSLGAVALRNG